MVSGTFIYEIANAKAPTTTGTSEIGKVPIYNGSGSFTTLTVSSVTVDSPIAGTTTVSVEWAYSTMATADGFAIQASSQTLTSDTTFVITQWDGIPFKASGGSQLYQLAGGVTAADTPTILANTSLLNCRT